MLWSANQNPKPGAREFLQDRLLVHTGADDARRLAGSLPHDIGGLVVTGSAAGAVIRSIRSYARFPILAAPRDPSKHSASEANPFGLPAKAKSSPLLFPDNLTDQVASQRLLGCDYVILSTGCIAAGDIGTLRAAYAQVNELTADDVIVCVNVERAWLLAEHRRTLIAHLNRIPHPVALGVADESKPFDAKYAVEGTLAILDAVEGLALFRTDHLGAGEAIARHAAASVGVRPGMRRVTPPGTKGHAHRPEDKTPHVYLPTLHRYSRTSEQNTWFQGHYPLVCAIPGCDGRSLDSYADDPVSCDLAHVHNARALAAFCATITGTVDSRRIELLADIYLDAAIAHRELGHRLGQFRPIPKELELFLLAAFRRLGRTIPADILG